MAAMSERSSKRLKAIKSTQLITSNVVIGQISSNVMVHDEASASFEDTPPWAQELINSMAVLQRSTSRCLDVLHNATAKKDLHTLSPVTNALGNFPPYYPPTREALLGTGGPVANRMNQARADMLITFYRLPRIRGNTDGALQRKIELIAEHIGVRI